ncbi:MAG: hypothetical protein IPM68_14000 [Flavobacteriales bacterium]|nr:hypothetical protein [Flavobacteriales bacterium]
MATPYGAGTDGAITVCSDAAPFDLFALLTGATTGGTWTAPGGATVGATFSPGTDAAGIYTYTVTTGAPCPGNDQSTVTVTVVDLPDPGTDGSITLCSTDAPADSSPFSAARPMPVARGAVPARSPAAASIGRHARRRVHLHGDRCRAVSERECERDRCGEHAS